MLLLLDDVFITMQWLAKVKLLSNRFTSMPVARRGLDPPSLQLEPSAEFGVKIGAV